jgi:DNA-directed RNA polymerase specialized sigma24 family protein
MIMDQDADLRSARRGDARAFARLLAEQRELIYAFGYRVLGEEQAAVAATQTGVNLAGQNIGAWREGTFRLWLLRWVAAACRERLGQAVPAHPATETGQSGAEDSRECIQCRLARLPIHLRFTLVLVDLCGCDYDEAAAVLSAPRELVALWLAQARARFGSE